MLLRLKKACIAVVTGAASLVVLSLLAFPGHAQQSPFANLSGSWSGSGRITLSNETRESIRCRATYDAHAGGNQLQLALRCASDSYNFEFRGNAINSDGDITGNWSETTRHVAGQFTGRASDNHIDVRAEGQTFAALLALTTHRNRQSISIRSPGSEMSEVTIVLSRRLQ
jgi:hypothetical protein